MTIRIVIADDHELVRSGFRSLLERQKDFEIVGEVGDGREAVQLAKNLKPNVVIMDVAMPNLNGTSATQQIVMEHPKIKVLALSMHSAQLVVVEMLKAGASGYLLKSCALEELVLAVRVVAKGKTYLSPDLVGGLVDDFVRKADENDDTSGGLSQREKEVLQLVAEGKSTKEVAALLFLSIKTVETHRSNIMKKLNLHSIAELTKFAVREGLTPLDY